MKYSDKYFQKLRQKALKDDEFSKEEKIELIYYYRSHLLEFIVDNIYLSEVGGTVRFTPYHKQLETIDDFLDYHYLFFLKSRQIGITTIVQAIIASIMVLYSNVPAGVVSKDSDEATKFVRQIKYMFENMPNWIKPKAFDKKLEQHLILTNGSQIMADTVNAQKPENCLRGEALAILVIDEAAFIDKVYDAYTGMGTAVTKAQKVAKRKGIPFGTFIISTPNKTTGVGEWYYKRYLEVESGNSSFKLVRIHWTDIEGLDEAWYKEACDTLHNDPLAIAQELDMKFIGTKYSVFPPDIQTYLQEKKNFPEPNIFKVKLELQRPGQMAKMEQEVNLKIFSRFDPQKFYLIGVDTASLEGTCKSSICVVEHDTLQIAAVYMGDIEPHLLVELIKKVMDIYPRCSTVIERNSYGLFGVKELTLYEEYSNRLFRTKKELKNSTEYFEGIETTSYTRPLIMTALKNYVLENYQEIDSFDLALQLVGLENKNGKIKHGTGSYDDLVLAFAFTCYIMINGLLYTNSFSPKEIEAMNSLILGESNDENLPVPADHNPKLVFDDDWADLFIKDGGPNAFI